MELNSKTREETANRRLSTIAGHLHLRPDPPVSPTSEPSFFHTVSADGSSDFFRPVVIGGMVLDIHAKPHSRTRPGTTTPGKVCYVRGGVARNIAECMAKLGTKPFMIGVLGNDMAGDVLLQHWKSSGLSTEGIMKSRNITTPVVLNVFDADGELSAGVASVDAVESCLTREWICRFQHNISSAPILLLDANLHPRLLEVACQIAAECSTPVWFEPVSVAKSERISSIVKYITCVSPNENELIAMANALSTRSTFHNTIERQWPIETSLQSLKAAINVLLEKGIKFVMVTLGSDGVLLCSRQDDPNIMSKSTLRRKTNPSYFRNPLYQQFLNDSGNSSHFSHIFKRFPNSDGQDNFPSYALHFPAPAASVMSLTGAGDCLVGGFLASICSGLDTVQSMAVAMSTAKAAVEVEPNVPSAFVLEKIADEAKQILVTARMFDL